MRVHKNKDDESGGVNITVTTPEQAASLIDSVKEVTLTLSNDAGDNGIRTFTFTVSEEFLQQYLAEEHTVSEFLAKYTSEESSEVYSLATLSNAVIRTDGDNWHEDENADVQEELQPLFNKDVPVNELNPQTYFNVVKERRKTVTSKELDMFYENCMMLIQKYNATGQKAALRKLLFQIDCIEKERRLLDLGIDTFVYEADVTEYIEQVAGKAVKIIDIENYQRDIPDEIVDVITKAGHLFDKLYIVFTDYTGEEERRIQKERRDKDPILFGTFRDDKNRYIVERFWYLGDWIDEYCDLTLDKMVSEMTSKGYSIEHKIQTPIDLAKLKAELNALDEKDSIYIRKAEEPKKSFIDKVRTAFGKA